MLAYRVTQFGDQADPIAVVDVGRAVQILR